MTHIDDIRTVLLGLDPKDGPLFAVLDGAKFDNLPNELVLGKFISRPLYLDRGNNNPEQVITAPQMVSLDELAEMAIGRPRDKTIDAIFDLIGDRTAAVFWQCPGGADALYRHLRGINMVSIPKWAAEDKIEESEADAEEPPEEQDESQDNSHRLVLFRHADPNVLAQVVPGLSAEELARLMGPAQRLIFAPDPIWSADGGAVSVNIKPEGIVPPPGNLRLSDRALDSVEDAQLVASRTRVTDYLRTTAPEYTSALTEDELRDLVLQSEQTGDEIGFRTEHAHGLWAFLALLTGGETLHNAVVREHFQNDPRDPATVLEEVYDQVINASDEELEAL
ncbi:hypothetical protein [Tabrizicola sp.]|uniref:hypothetical protein n=1 Tax=Tabrizicola sp. TaxID=2005166 RepID=UPI003F3DE8FE